MTHRWSVSWRRGATKARATRAHLRVEHLEARTLLTASLVVVPSPVVTGGTLYGASAIASNDIWAVGVFETLNPITGQIEFDPLAEHFNGTSWSVVPTPSIQNGGYLLGVAKVASNDVWAVGFQFANDGISLGNSVIEHWNGTSWSVVSSGTVQGALLNGVTGVSSNDVWAVGTNNALVMHWNGTTWSAVSSPAFTGVGSLSAVSSDASNDVWALGCCGGPGQAILHWNGTSWSIAGSHPRFGPLAVTALSPTNVWVAGNIFDSDNDARIAAVEHWDGTSWSIVPSPNPNPGLDRGSELSGIAAISANDIWAVGTIGVPFGHLATLTEHWDGTSWTIIPSPNPGDTANKLMGVTALSDGTVAAVGHQSGSTSDSGLILQNAASAPMSASMTGLLAAFATTAGTTTATPTTTRPAPLDAALVEQFFAAAGKADQPLSFAGRSPRAHQMADSGELDALGGTTWQWDLA